MNLRNLLCFVIFAVLINVGFCFGDENRDHICFRSIDTNHDGIVTFQEFKEVLGDDKSKYDEIDSNKDGMLSHEEYHKILGHGAP